MANLDSSVQYLKGVGPAFAKKFAKLGIVTVRDLLLCYPRKYIDYTQPYAIAEAPYDADCCVKATVLQKEPNGRIIRIYLPKTGNRLVVTIYLSRSLPARSGGMFHLVTYRVK